MSSSIYYAAGSAMTSLGGFFAIVLPYKCDLGILKKMPSDIKALAGTAAYILTLETVKSFVEESDPFWMGVSKAMPMVVLLAGNVVGQTLQTEEVASKEPDILLSQQYKENLKSWSHTLRVGLSCGLVSAISPSIVAYPVAGALGSLLGRHYIQNATNKAQETFKKIQ